MKSDDDKTRAGFEQWRDGDQSAPQRSDFVIHGNTESLENARGRMHPAAAAEYFFDEGGQLAGARKG